MLYKVCDTICGCYKLSFFFSEYKCSISLIVKNEWEKVCLDLTYKFYSCFFTLFRLWHNVVTIFQIYYISLNYKKIFHYFHIKMFSIHSVEKRKWTDWLADKNIIIANFVECIHIYYIILYTYISSIYNFMYVYTFISIYISSIYLEPQKVVFASFICFNKKPHNCILHRKKCQQKQSIQHL